MAFIPVPNRPPPRAAPMGARPPGVTAPAAAKPFVSRLGGVKRGLLRESKRFFFYGPEGVGKSSLAADAGAIFFDTDRGSGALDVQRYVFRDGDDGHIAESLAEIYSGVEDLLVSAHEYKAIAIDTTDALEAMIFAKVCAGRMTKGGDKIEGIEDFGFGKGYTAAAEEWRRLLHRLDQLRIKRQMNIILIGHSQVKTFKNPLGEDFDRYRPKLDDRALGLLREWCEVVGFVTFDDIASKQGSMTRARGVSTGSRIIHLEHNAAWDAKSRLPLPSTIELSLESPWAPFEAAVQALLDATPDALRAKITAELARVGEQFTRSDGKEVDAESVRVAVASAGDDIATLSKYLVVLNQSSPKEAV